MHSRMGTTLTAFLLRIAHWLSVHMTQNALYVFEIFNSCIVFRLLSAFKCHYIRFAL